MITALTQYLSSLPPTPSSGRQKGGLKLSNSSPCRPKFPTLVKPQSGAIHPSSWCPRSRSSSAFGRDLPFTGINNRSGSGPKHWKYKRDPSHTWTWNFSFFSPSLSDVSGQVQLSFDKQSILSTQPSQNHDTIVRRKASFASIALGVGQHGWPSPHLGPRTRLGARLGGVCGRHRH